MKENEKTVRQSNFELLRIICMLSIVIFHIYTQTDARELRPENGALYFLFVFLGYGGRLVCNCFVMIGAWFLCDTNFKAERIVNLWLQVFLYAAGITCICFIFGVHEATIVTLVQAFLPIMGRPVWFAAEYMCMLMLTPFLNMLLVKEEAVCRKLLVIFGILIIGCATLFPIEHTTPAFSELVWFLWLYLFVAYFKRHPCIWMGNKRVCIIGMIAAYNICVALYILLNNCGMDGVAIYYLNHYENFFSFMISAFLFYAFKNMDIGRIKAVNVIGESTFAVYVLHQVSCFYPTLWNGIFSVNDNIFGLWGIVYIAYVIFMIFLFSIIIENVRRYVFNKFVYKTKAYKILCESIENFYFYKKNY